MHCTPQGSDRSQPSSYVEESHLAFSLLALVRVDLEKLLVVASQQVHPVTNDGSLLLLVVAAAG